MLRDLTAENNGDAGQSGSHARILPSSPSLAAPLYPLIRRDIIICTVLAIASAIYAVVLQQMIAYTNTNLDIWFDSDSLFIVGQETDRFSRHNDTNSRHPIFALLTFPVGFTLNKLGLSPEMAVLPILVVTSTLFVVTSYLILRLMDKPVAVALVFTGILAVSTPGMFFLGLHERLVPAGLSVLLLIATFLAYQRRLLPVGWMFAAAALTLGMTITNFAYALVALPLLLGFWRGLQGLTYAFASIAFLSIFVPVLFPGSTAFLDVRTFPYETTSFSGDERRLAKAGSTTDKLSTIFLHSVAMPEPDIEQKPTSAIRYLTVQKVGVSSNQFTWYVCSALWLGLLGAGFYAAFVRMKTSRLLTPTGISQAWRTGAEDPFPWMIVITALGQIALFMLFGAEIILFSLYFVPALIFISAMAWKPGRYGAIVLGVAVALLVVLAWNNGSVFIGAAETGRTLILPPGAL